MNIVIVLIFVKCLCLVSGQDDPGGGNINGQRQYNRAGVYVEPGEIGYSTFVFKGRRYGGFQPYPYGDDRNQYQPSNPYQPYQPNYGNNQYNPLNPYNAQDLFDYNQNDPQRVVLPGVLGGWRPDLQGKQRQDSINLPRDIFVNTFYGQVQGFKVYLYDNPDPNSGYRPQVNVLEKIFGVCSVFLGIPYAMPPTDEGRFKPPRPHKSWQQIAAVDFGPACPQPKNYIGVDKGVNDVDEDCLYLNVFTPNIEHSSGRKYPVMVYIHGGEFTHGASNLFPAHIMSTFYEVVVVTLNYRLGALGFLSTADENSPGNYGILDQAMALRWIYDNIEAFNGDRSSITLFGPDAGAASAGLLMVAPDTKDLITGVIAQSGSALADWAFIVDKYRAQNTSRVFGLKIGCSIESSWKLVNCLKRSRSFAEIGNAILDPEVGTFPWAPVIDQNLTMPFYDGWRERDWHFLRETPEQLIRKGHFNPRLRYMSGVTTQEAAFFIKNNASLDPYYEINEEFMSQKTMEFVLKYNYTLNPVGVYEAIRYMYTYWPDPFNNTHFRDQYIKMLSDFLYVAPHDKIAKELLQKNIPLYLYVMNTTVESLNYDEWYKYTHNIEHLLLAGAPFMDEEFFPKHSRINRYQWTNNDRNMSHFFMKAYTDFAKYGNPSQQQILGIHFERAQPGFLKYLNINTTYNSTILWDYRQTESAFWFNYLPTVIGRLLPTYPPITEIWWEPKQPLQIAFWSVSATCLLLVVMVVVCCMLWRSAKRTSDQYYSGDMFMVHDNPDADQGMDNHNSRAESNIYEYRDVPSPQTLTTKSSRPTVISNQPGGGHNDPASSMGSLLTGSALSLRDSKSQQPQSLTNRTRSRTQLVQGVPQTQV